MRRSALLEAFSSGKVNATGRAPAATATIALLAEVAVKAGVRPIALTLPEENASNKALRRNGFVYAGEVMDPEDGLVWRWEKGAAA